MATNSPIDLPVRIFFIFKTWRIKCNCCYIDRFVCYFRFYEVSRGHFFVVYFSLLCVISRIFERAVQYITEWMVEYTMFVTGEDNSVLTEEHFLWTNHGYIFLFYTLYLQTKSVKHMNYTTKAVLMFKENFCVFFFFLHILTKYCPNTFLYQFFTE